MPYNVERILLMASKMDTKRVQKIMTEFENSQENGTKIPADILSAIQSVVVGKFSRKKLFFLMTQCKNSIQHILLELIAQFFSVLEHYDTVFYLWVLDFFVDSKCVYFIHIFLEYVSAKNR